jgi:hypothetical protein
MHSRTWSFVAFVSLLSLPCAAQELRVVSDERWCREDGEGWREKARFCEVREATLPAGGTLAVDARPNGGIRAEGRERGDVRLRVKIVATAGSHDAARALAEQVQVATSGTISATGPARSDERQWHASFKLEVPREQALQLRADNGGLHLSGVEGDVELSTVNGGLHLEQVGGHITGQTVNGGIHLELEGSEWRGEGLDLRTTNGGLHLEVPAGYNARLEASTVNGGVHSDLPGTKPARRSGGRIAAELGQGGQLLKLATTNGGLHVATGR